MAAKTGTWLILLGGFVVFVGLCFIPAAFGPSPEKSYLGAGFAIFATGALLAATGLYVKARTLAGLTPVAASANAKRSRKASCDRCGKNEPAVQCRVHQIHLCSDCLSEHYDFRSCAYIPSTRRAASAHAAGA
jgi:ribosomal protein L37AE/L43A